MCFTACVRWLSPEHVRENCVHAGSRRTEPSLHLQEPRRTAETARLEGRRCGQIPTLLQQEPAVHEPRPAVPQTLWQGKLSLLSGLERLVELWVLKIKLHEFILFGILRWISEFKQFMGEELEWCVMTHTLTPCMFACFRMLLWMSVCWLPWGGAWCLPGLRRTTRTRCSTAPATAAVRTFWRRKHTRWLIGKLPPRRLCCCRLEEHLWWHCFLPKDPLVKGQRCVILADGFYEWRRQEKDKQPFFIYFPQTQRTGQEKKENQEDFLNPASEESEMGFSSGEASQGLTDVSSGESRKDEEASAEWTGWRLLTIAGLFDCWTPPDGGEPLYTYSVITVNASPNLESIHDRYG